MGYASLNGKVMVVHRVHGCMVAMGVHELRMAHTKQHYPIIQVVTMWFLNVLRILLQMLTGRLQMLLDWTLHQPMRSALPTPVQPHFQPAQPPVPHPIQPPVPHPTMVTIHQGYTFVRGIRKGHASSPFPARLWCTPTSDTSAVIGEKRYTYIATQQFQVHTAEQSVAYFTYILGAEFERDLNLFFFIGSNVDNEERVLDALFAVREQYNIYGVFRRQGDGPVFIFFGDMVNMVLNVNSMSS